MIDDNGTQRNVKIWQSHVNDDCNEDSSNEAVGTIVSANKKGISIVCGDKRILTITKLQPPGKKPMAAHEFLNARSNWFSVGDVLDTEAN